VNVMSLSKTTVYYRAQDVQQSWYVVDLKDAILGRAAVRIAQMLRGKNKPTFTPNADTGDFVICINAGAVKFTGNKIETKLYRRHTGWFGGLKTEPARIFAARKPEEAIRLAVRGMLPKGPLGRALLKKLKVYAGAEHPHDAQKPVNYELV